MALAPLRWLTACLRMFYNGHMYDKEFLKKEMASKPKKKKKKKLTDDKMKPTPFTTKDSYKGKKIKKIEMGPMKIRSY